jgi:RNA polymerase sigma-70 factor (ECF subfamily)
MKAAPATPPAAPPAEGSSDPLERFFARHQAELLGTLYYLVGNLEDARDALQETFVKCWRHRETAAGVDNLRAWVFRVALNTGRDLRGTAWRRRRRPLAEEEALPPGRDATPESDLARREQLDQLRAALAALRPEEQEVFLLRQNGELKYEEIAAALDIPLGTVKTRMRLALTKLRAVLAD